VAPHPEHDAVLNVEQNLLLLSVVPDEGMQGVTVGHPANQAGVGGQGDHCVALNADETQHTQQRQRRTIYRHCLVFFTTVRVLVYVCVCAPDKCEVDCTSLFLSLRVCVYLRFLRKDAGSLASSVLTRPNSCMTLSSCLRSSWPFNRNMNSWPLLPAEGATQHGIDALHFFIWKKSGKKGGRARRYVRNGSDGWIWRCRRRSLQLHLHYLRLKRCRVTFSRRQ